ncbi:CRR6 family NdhI maturation factor [Cyanobacterium sp. uoEpiScrs1]|uniref:CRR6 family NdhI maturation factor n=1 Tax=Cyanobacterium sp. uoEpiScrs1 TaxID=2976343 RepID=UPI002269EA49|nr:CRR6 family NdhI maturation factor [Cyanobacterium sp. uoEpiScrs1]
MTYRIILQPDHLMQLDLSPVTTIIEPILMKTVQSKAHQNEIISYEQTINFEINYPRDSDDPRELSEIPEVRLWFIRLDSIYPWIPFILNWKEGELARYFAMLVPHQFSQTEGIQYNPEALEIFVMHKLFILSDWLKYRNIPHITRLQSMAKMFGYDLDKDFFRLIY